MKFITKSSKLRSSSGRHCGNMQHAAAKYVHYIQLSQCDAGALLGDEFLSSKVGDANTLALNDKLLPPAEAVVIL